jgi:hypothetical protein
MAAAAGLGLALAGPAHAAEAELRGHLKGFFVGVFPYEHLIMPADPVGSATLNARLIFEARPADGILLEFHPQVNATIGGATLGAFSTGVGRTAPEAMPLTASLTDGDAFRTTFRVDRLGATFNRGPVRFTLGRQPVTFGQGQLFTPLDLVAPFTPTTLDTSYKPGVDAARADVFLGMSGRVTALAAYLGEWGPAGSAFVLQGQGTIVTVDVGGFVGSLYGDAVVGASVYAPIGPIGLYGDVAVTIVEDEPELRAVVGFLARPGATTSIVIEVYGQTFGTTDAADYLVVGAGERHQRGDLWLAGHLYAAIAFSQEITPLLHVNASLIGNLLDPSFLLAPSLSWSLASNADLSFGAQIGIGERPEEVAVADLIDDAFQPLQGDALLRALGVRSEFGTSPVTVFVQAGFYW